MPEVPSQADDPKATLPPTEKQETLSLEAEVYGPCESTGENVGLSAEQRRNLGVDLEDIVVVRDMSGKRLGFFTVLKVSNDARNEGKITANVSNNIIRIEKLPENVPSIVFELVGKHLSAGNFVGLSCKQRRILGVKEDDIVRLRSGDMDLGEFTVARGRLEHVNLSNMITANVPPGVKGNITVEKISSPERS